MCCSRCCAVSWAGVEGWRAAPHVPVFLAPRVGGRVYALQREGLKLLVTLSKHRPEWSAFSPMFSSLLRDVCATHAAVPDLQTLALTLVANLGAVKAKTAMVTTFVEVARPALATHASAPDVVLQVRRARVCECVCVFL
jgi:hypothetical protein